MSRIHSRYPRLLTILACLVFASAHGASAATTPGTYPARPIRMIVTQGAGSTPDLLARLVAAELAREFGQQIVVDNRPAGASMIGTELTVRAPADGHTLAFVPISALAITPHLSQKFAFDVRTDLQPIAHVANGQMVLTTSPTGPFKTVRQVIEHARQYPNRLSYGSSGNGTASHVGLELLKAMTGTEVVHVPYKAGPAAFPDLVSGVVHLMLDGIGSTTPHVKAGRVRALGVSGRHRSEALPDVPTIAEGGIPGYEVNTWGGIVGPAGIPAIIVARLNVEINKAVASESVRQRFRSVGIEPAGSSPEQFAALIRTEYAKWGEVVKRSGARID